VNGTTGSDQANSSQLIDKIEYWTRIGHLQALKCPFPQLNNYFKVKGTSINPWKFIFHPKSSLSALRIFVIAGSRAILALI
jgi:hypothetical protein